MSKPRVNLRLSHKLYAELEGRAAKPGVTKTQIVEAALEQYFAGMAEGKMSSQLSEQFSVLTQKLAKCQSDVKLTNEMLAQFVLYWLTRIEPLAEEERKEAHELGQKRFEYFMEQVAIKSAIKNDENLYLQRKYIVFCVLCLFFCLFFTFCEKVVS